MYDEWELKHLSFKENVKEVYQSGTYDSSLLQS